jgi:hypothetical protein
MLSWDIKGQMRLSVLNDNLVVRFTDYLSGEPFYSFLGDSEVNKTVEKLLEISKKEGLEPLLKLLPELIVNQLAPKFDMIEDIDNFDYIYDLKLISEYRGNKFETKRGEINFFLKSFPNISVENLDFNDSLIQKKILNLDDNWFDKKIKRYFDFQIKNEFLASKRFFQSDGKNIIGVGVINDKKLIGYSIFEILVNGYSICHFSKADIDFSGIYDYLTRESAKILMNQGSAFLNYEQDLGILGLRHSKGSFRPVAFLKKFVCAQK